MKNPNHLPPPRDPHGNVAYTSIDVLKELFHPLRGVDKLTWVGNLPDEFRQHPSTEACCVLRINAFGAELFTTGPDSLDFIYQQGISRYYIEEVAQEWNEHYDARSE
jgi:hypothetical protein